MRREFAELHKRRFGYFDEDAEVILDALLVEAIARTSLQETPLSQAEQQAWTGPAVIFEPTSTIVLEAGWRAERSAADGTLILTRATPLLRTKAIGTDVDPVRLEIFNNLFMAIAEEMGVALQSTATSVNIKERLDFSCAIFDAEGALIANAPHIPVHLGSMGESIRRVIDTRGQTRDGRGIRRGDAYVLNDPYRGGTHLPDITVIVPVFYGDGSERVGTTQTSGASRRDRCRRIAGALIKRACSSTTSCSSMRVISARSRCGRSLVPPNGPLATRTATSLI
jgi:5-oxoprolinase (ATP-hydrolysing)